MWKKLTASLAAAALAACCPLSAGDSCKPGDCHHDGRKNMPCRTPMDTCTTAGKPACCKNRKVVKITPIRKAAESDPGFIAILEEYSVTTDIPVQTQDPGMAESGKPENPAN